MNVMIMRFIGRIWQVFNALSNVLVDEAAQATEPSLAPALQLVASEHFNVQIILSGDPKQLGPYLVSDTASNYGLSLSLMERLTFHGYYNNSNAPLLTLCKNYRSHATLLMMPSALFYFKDLIPCRNVIINDDFSYFSRVASYSYTQISPLKDVPNFDSKWPFLFYPVRGTEKHGHLENVFTAGWYNPEEASVILTLVQMMIKNSGKSVKDDIGIMTVSRRQVVHLRNIFRAADLSDVNIGTVEDYQGMERKYIFLSTVRISEDLVNQDLKQNTGLVNQHKTLNVALSRAQDLMIIVGSPKHLWQDNLWKQIFFFCDRNGLWMKKPEKQDEIQFVVNQELVVKPNIQSYSTIQKPGASKPYNVLVSDLEQSFRAHTTTNSFRAA